MDFDKRALTWDDEYRISRAKIIAQEIEKWVPIRKEHTALEFGCGTGLISFNLYESLRHITLVDTSKGMVEVANAKIQQYGATNVTAYELDISKGEKPEENYDIIYTSMVLHHIEDLKGTIEKLLKILNSNGYLCIVDLVKEDGSFHKDSKDFKGHNGFEEDRLKGLLSTLGLKDIKSKIFYEGQKIIGEEKVKYSLFIMVGKRD